MTAIDRNFLEFEKDLYRQGLRAGIGTDWILLALGGVTATVGGEATKSALGAATTGIIGAKASFDKQAFMEKSLIAIIAQMRADRASSRLDIRRGMRSGIETYSLDDGLNDLQNYYDSGTLPSALNSFVQSAGTQETKATEEIRKLTKASYVKDNAGDILRLFWKPDGSTIDGAKQTQLQEWMQQNGFDTGAGSITMFLRSKEATPFRAKAVEDLKLE